MPDKTCANWEELYAAIWGCKNCGLYAERERAVPGEGNLGSPLMFVGEGPGRDEDEQGRPFVGAAGQLLDRMIIAMGLERKQVYIANVVKCRPPFNRTPLQAEIDACMPFLRQQFVFLRPKVIVCLGATAARALIAPDLRISRSRGVWTERKGVWFMPTFHPAALLRTPELKRDAWRDLQAVRAKLIEIGEFPEG